MKFSKTGLLLLIGLGLAYAASPRFDNAAAMDLALQSLKENTPANQQIGPILTCSDPDGDTTRIRVFTGENYIQIRRGKVSLRNTLDRESPDVPKDKNRRKVAFLCEEIGTPDRESDLFESVLGLADVNDNAPTFVRSDDAYYTIIPENQEIGSVIYDAITVTDPDGNDNNVIEAVCEKLCDLFGVRAVQIENKYGIYKFEIFTKVSFMDLEETDYTMKISAKDNPVSEQSLKANETHNVVIAIRDIQNLPPEFALLSFTFDMLEDSPVNLPLAGRVAAYDGDTGDPNDIEFELFEHPDDIDGVYRNGYFSLGPTSLQVEGPNLITVATLIPMKPIDREMIRDSAKLLRLGIRAIEVIPESKLNDPDRIHNPMNATESIQITVLDINDERPMFNQDSYMIEFQERAREADLSQFHQISNDIRITVTDKDGSGYNNFDISISEGNDDQMFTLNRYSGTGEQDITITAYGSVLDYEKEKDKVKRLVLLARDTNKPELFSTAEVFIELTDENDNAPVFGQTSYKFAISESDTYGNPLFYVGTVEATDADSGVLGEIVKYEITPNQTKFVIFDDGKIYASAPIDYETDSHQYTFAVIAYDGGVGDDQQQKRVGVQIFINNVVDIGPNFIQDRYETFVTEGETILRPPVRLTAVDPERVGTLTYHVNHTVPSLPGYFYIPDPTRGELLLVQPIDYKDTRVGNDSGTIIVKVQACTSGGCAETNVIVTVRDQNNFPPVFKPSEQYRVFLNESAKAGDVVLRVSTTDQDAETDPFGANAQVRYILGPGGQEKFLIGEDSGEIIVSKNNVFDIELYSQYIMTVIANDKGNPRMSATATVTVILRDSNNKPPTFTESAYFFTIKDNVQHGTDVGQVLANDPDTDHKIVYSIDINNFYVTIKGETITSGDSIVAAKRALMVDPQTGWIKTNSTLDRTKYEVINFAVIAEDIAIDKTKQSPQTATALVIVTILGSEDTSPVYLASSWSRDNPFIKLNRPETDEINWKLFSLNAYDPKTAEAITRYEIIDGTNDEDYFELETSETQGFGIVRVKQRIDYEVLKRPNKTPQLSVGIRAWASDMERFVDATIILTINDLNDNIPRFLKAYYEFDVLENANFAQSVGSVMAEDADTGTYGQIRYSLEGTNSDHFIIVTNPVQQGGAKIFVGNKTIDYETISRYTLYVTATDNVGINTPSTEQNKDSVVLIINVLDVNDNNPEFQYDEYRMSVVGTKPVGQAIDYILATDLDKGKNGELTYYIAPETSKNATEFFGVATRVQGTTTLVKMGRIYVKSSLRNLPDNEVFHLIVTAEDNGEPIRRGKTRVIITVTKGVKDPKPKWDSKLKAKVYVYEDEKPGYSVANVTAYPANKTSAVTYSFVTSGTIDGDYTMFLINNQTGHVTLNGYLDYETKKDYNLLIRATDVSNSSLDNQFLMSILVRDVDDNRPAFNACANIEFKIPTPAEVSEGKPPGTYVFTAKACDLDSAVHNRVQYSWYFDNVGSNAYCKQSEVEPFRLNENTGEIHTRDWLDREEKDQHLLCVLVEPFARKKRALSEIEIAEMSKDLENRNRTDILYVLVTVIDANDEGPEFLEDTITRVILEHPPYLIDHAVATDKDQAPNNLIRYTIQSIMFTKGRHSYQAPTAFNINSQNGAITRGTHDYSEYVDGHFIVTVRAEDANGDFNETDTMQFRIIVGHSSKQVRVVFNHPADETVEKKAHDMIRDLNGLKEAGVYYEIQSIGYHIISNVDDPVFDKTDVCMVIVKDDIGMTALDATKRLANEQKVHEILNQYGAVEPGPCEPARSVYPEGWESYWWVLVAFAIFIFIITLILIIIVVFLYRSYKRYMDSQRTYLVAGN